MIGDSLDYSIVSSLRADVPEDFSGSGSLHVQLLQEASASDKFLEIKLSSQIALSKLHFEMPDTKSFRKVHIHVSERGIQYPDEWTDLGVNKLDYRKYYVVSIC